MRYIFLGTLFTICLLAEEANREENETALQVYQPRERRFFVTLFALGAALIGGFTKAAAFSVAAGKVAFMAAKAGVIGAKASAFAGMSSAAKLGVIGGKATLAKGVTAAKTTIKMSAAKALKASKLALKYKQKVLSRVQSLAQKKFPKTYKLAKKMMKLRKKCNANKYCTEVKDFFKEKAKEEAEKLLKQTHVHNWKFAIKATRNTYPKSWSKWWKGNKIGLCIGYYYGNCAGYHGYVNMNSGNTQWIYGKSKGKVPTYVSLWGTNTDAVFVDEAKMYVDNDEEYLPVSNFWMETKAGCSWPGYSYLNFKLEPGYGWKNYRKTCKSGGRTKYKYQRSNTYSFGLQPNNDKKYWTGGWIKVYIGFKNGGYRRRYIKLNNARPKSVTGRFRNGNEPNYVSLKALSNDGGYVRGAWMTVNDNPQYFPVENFWLDGNGSGSNSWSYTNFYHRVVGMTENKIGYWEQVRKRTG